jgi:hypothetical protein
VYIFVYLAGERTAALLLRYEIFQEFRARRYTGDQQEITGMGANNVLQLAFGVGDFFLVGRIAKRFHIYCRECGKKGFSLCPKIKATMDTFSKIASVKRSQNFTI